MDSLPMSSAEVTPSAAANGDGKQPYSATPSSVSSSVLSDAPVTNIKSITGIHTTSTVASINSTHSSQHSLSPSTLMIAVPASLLPLAKPAPSGFEAETRIRLRINRDGSYSYISTHCQLVPIPPSDEETDPTLAAATAAAAAAAAAARATAASSPSTTAFPYKFAVAPPAPPAPRPPQPSPSVPAPPSKLFSSEHGAAAQRIHSKVVFSDEDDDHGDEEEEEEIDMEIADEDASVPPHDVIDVDEEDAAESEMGDEMSDVEGEGDGDGDGGSEAATESNSGVLSTASLINIPRNQWPNTKNKKARSFSKGAKNLSAYTSFNSWLQKIHHPGRTIFECTPDEVVKIVPQWLLEAKTYTGGLYKFCTLKGYVNILTNLTKLMKPVEEWTAINLGGQPEVLAALATLRQREKDANTSAHLLANPHQSSNADGPLMTRRGLSQSQTPSQPTTGTGTGETPSPHRFNTEPHEAETTTSTRAPRLSAAHEHLLFHSQNPTSAYGLLWLNFFNFIKYLGSFFVDEHRNSSIKQIIVASKVLHVKYQFPANQDEKAAEPDENTPFEICDESDPSSVPREVKFAVFTPYNNRRHRRFMYERPFEGKYCPVRLWLEYLSHRPPLNQDWGADQEMLYSWWMLPKRSLMPGDTEWYATSLGKQKIGSVLATQTQKIGLPPVYNNQSLEHQPKPNIPLSDEELHQMVDAWASKSFGVPTREEQHATNQKLAVQQKSNPTPVNVESKQADRRIQAVAAQHANGMHASSHGAPLQSHPHSHSPHQQDHHSRQSNPTMFAGTKRSFHTTDPSHVADPVRFQQLHQQMDEIFKRQKLDETNGSTAPAAPPAFIAANDAAAAAAKSYTYAKPLYSAPSILNAAFSFPPPLYPTSFGGLASAPLTLIPPSLDGAANLLTFVDQFQQEINQMTSYASKCQTSLNAFKDIISQLKSDSQAVIRVEQQTAKIAQQFQEIEEQKFLIQQLQQEKEQWMKEKAQSTGNLKQHGMDGVQDESKMDIDDDNDAGEADLPPLLAAETANLLRAASKAGIGGPATSINGTTAQSTEPQKSAAVSTTGSASTSESKTITSEPDATPAAPSNV